MDSLHVNILITSFRGLGLTPTLSFRLIVPLRLATSTPCSSSVYHLGCLDFLPLPRTTSWKRALIFYGLLFWMKDATCSPTSLRPSCREKRLLAGDGYVHMFNLSYLYQISPFLHIRLLAPSIGSQDCISPLRDSSPGTIYLEFKAKVDNNAARLSSQVTKSGVHYIWLKRWHGRV